MKIHRQIVYQILSMLTKAKCRYPFYTVIMLIPLLYLSGTVLAVDDKATRLKMLGYKYYTGKGTPIDYTRALRLYRQSAMLGDAEAQLVYGGMLYKGQGGDVNRREAFKWLLNAAEQGQHSPESMHIIGSLYLRGDGVPQNFAEARRWLQPAADSGIVPALNDLAYMYYQGMDGEQDYSRALALYREAAMLGDIQAQANVGMMYATGTGVAIDTVRGYAWSSIAASKGNTGAALYRNTLMIEMSWDELNKAQALSLELYRQVEDISLSSGQEIQ